MKAARIDQINIGLIILSFALAIWLPIHLFLFAYIVLGPLHYLTEIGWLNKRDFFVKKRRDSWLLVLLCIVVSVAYYLNKGDFGADAQVNSWQHYVHRFNAVAGGGLVFFAFAAALILGFIKQENFKFGLLVFAGICALFVHKINFVLVLFGILVPTIIHVSLFTALFMLYGALKSQSKWGYLSVILFLIGCVGIFFTSKSPTSVNAAQDSLQVLLDSSFIHLGALLTELVGARESGSDYMLLTEIGIKIQSFFAFCYTYHYLNWFSKTKVINWHEVSKNWLIGTFILWSLALLLYMIDYTIGFMALFFLSLLHVFLEFPSNHQSVYGIINVIRRR